MKKLLFLLLLITTFGYSQGIKEPDFYRKEIITGTVEINGHVVKDIFIFQSSFDGIKIYNRDNSKEYTFRKCDKDKCKIIHLVPKAIYTTSIPSGITLTPYTYGL